MQCTKPHAALLASPGMGHLFPVLELGKRLVSNHGFHVTIFVLNTEASTAKNQLRDSPDSSLLNLVPLPPVDISGKVGPDAHVVTLLVVMMRESLPGLRSTISAMKCRPTVLIVDLFGTEAMAVADEFMMSKFVFIASNAWFLTLAAYFPTIDEMAEDEHIKEQQPLKIPGCKPVRFEDTLEAYLDRNNQMYDDFTRVGHVITAADGILVNTFEDLEPATLRALRDSKKLGKIATVPVYTIGPIVRQLEPPVMGNPVLDWLDMQPTESVIYVSFGSGGTLPVEQMTELATGLELSQQRFIWVVRPPVENDVCGSFFTVGKSSDGTPNYLPEGFLTRTKDRGLIVNAWAPQTLVLSHPAVGGFLSHCGWNSTLESLTNGIPMIVWPLYAEQKMNATMLTEELGMAFRPKASESSGIVEREEIEMMVRKIMVEEEGHRIRNRVKELKQRAHKAMEKGGSSYSSFSQFARECEISLKARAQGA
ncbi:hypothetical protein SLA2020_514460 [Shorea laevis]